MKQERWVPTEDEIHRECPELFRLPYEIRSKAIFHGHSFEYGWKAEYVESAILAAGNAGLAVIGGQVQFQTETATCEAYWLNYDSGVQQPDENWAEYTTRSSQQALTQFKRILEKSDFVEEARNWEILSAKIDSENWDPRQAVVFMLYFNEEVRNEDEGGRESK